MIEERVFALGIKRITEPGRPPRFGIKSETMISREIVLTLIQHWLQLEQEKYHDRFKAGAAA